MEADETPEDRLEAALERIARVMDADAGTAPVAAEVAARLDRIIATLRDALGK